MSHTLFVNVSYARTPVDEISGLHARILGLGWEPTGNRGDPWIVTYSKSAENQGDVSKTELADVMGDYWLDTAATDLRK